MEVDSRERPFLVDKRMVTQMLAAYLEQRDHPGPQQEIMAKMADLLGFSTSEREQVGLSQKRKGPIASEEPANLADLTDRFVDFLMEEPWVDSEGIIMFSESINPLCMSSCSFVLLFFKRLFDQRVL
ncbi:Uncharacterized protein SCF082_LOCUS53140 [Durusdinium trenchii]